MSYHTKHHSRAGFTIIELTLAMLFVTFLLIFCATTLVQVLRMYDKGSAIKQMNQASRLINDELARAIRSASDGASITYPSGGVFDRICINDSMYVWNVLYDAGANPYPAAAAARNQVAGRPIGMMKLTLTSSGERAACTAAGALTRGALRDGESEILGGSARIAQAAIDRTSDGRVYILDFRIGTYLSTEMSLTPTNRTVTPSKQEPADVEVKCPPGDAGNYCFVNDMQLMVYAANVKE